MNRPKLPGTIELDTQGHFLEPLHAYNNSDEIIGYIEHHPSATDGMDCSGGIYLEGKQQAKPNWQLVEGTPEDPITLSPSIQCRTCNKHGWIRDRKWVPA